MIDYKKVLTDARALIAAGWTQEKMARDANMRSVPPRDPTAVFFCIYGAIERAVGNNTGAEIDRVGDFVGAQRTTRERHIELWLWNDAYERRKEDVLVLFDKAIAKLEAEQTGSLS